MKASLWEIFTAVVFVIVVSVALQAQASGSISGSVVDKDGAVVPKAEALLVRIVDGNEQVVARATIGDDGTYAFQNVAFGRYALRALWQGVTRGSISGIDIRSAGPKHYNVVIHWNACFDERTGRPPRLSDRAEIVRMLVDLRFGDATVGQKILVPRNIDTKWLGDSQRSRFRIMTRRELQVLANKEGNQVYYWISKIRGRGRCVAIDLVENMAVKNKRQDATKRGEGRIYEFRKTNGRWTGQYLSAWIILD